MRVIVAGHSASNDDRLCGRRRNGGSRKHRTAHNKAISGVYVIVHTGLPLAAAAMIRAPMRISSCRIRQILKRITSSDTSGRSLEIVFEEMDGLQQSETSRTIQFYDLSVLRVCTLPRIADPQGRRMPSPLWLFGDHIFETCTSHDFIHPCLMREVRHLPEIDRRKATPCVRYPSSFSMPA